MRKQRPQKVRNSQHTVVKGFLDHLEMLEFWRLWQLESHFRKCASGTEDLVQMEQRLPSMHRALGFRQCTSDVCVEGCTVRVPVLRG